MAEGGRHVPVLLDEVLGALCPEDGEVHVDGTFGGGGYTTAILSAADCRVIAIDRDPDAIARGADLQARYGDRLRLIEGRFSGLDDLLDAAGEGPVDGVVLDIGVSSFQLDEADRGFSFQKDGPLDMRMGQSGPTAADLVNGMAQGELADLIFNLGEEPRSRRIAAAIVRARTEEPIETTGRLAAIVSDAVGGPRRGPGKQVHPATRTFQALRIAVNAELEELRSGLSAAEAMLRPGGRLVVVSFHSLEDRIVKSFLAERSGRVPAASRHLPPAEESARAPSFHLAKKGAIKPADREIKANPRSRSARLRVGVRTEAPAWPAGEVAA